MLAGEPAGDEYALVLKDYREVENVLAELRARGIEIAHMELEQSDLEEVFVQVMRKEYA
jgi:ABC-2 type transport system ATP-binding protein